MAGPRPATHSVYNTDLQDLYSGAAPRSAGSEILIYYSTDGGLNYTLLQTLPGGLTGILNTGGATTTTFVTTAAQWATQTIPLPEGTNMVKFTAISAYGNNLYIDNVRIEASAAPAELAVQGTRTGTACYNAIQTITVGGAPPYALEPGGIATFIAGQKISFIPGSQIKSQSCMHAYITENGTYCGDPVLPPAMTSRVLASGDIEGAVNGHYFRVYPNAASDRICLESLAESKTGRISLSVNSLTGTLLLKIDLTGDNRYRIPLSGFAPGLYFVSVHDGTHSETFKVIKQ